MEDLRPARCSALAWGCVGDRLGHIEDASGGAVSRRRRPRKCRPAEAYVVVMWLRVSSTLTCLNVGLTGQTPLGLQWTLLSERCCGNEGGAGQAPGRSRPRPGHGNPWSRLNSR